MYQLGSEGKYFLCYQFFEKRGKLMVYFWVGVRCTMDKAIRQNWSSAREMVSR